MKRPNMTTPAAPPSAVKRRRFLMLRVLLFLASLPLLYWAIKSYGSSFWSYASSYAGLNGFWFWLATLLIVWGTWSVYRRLKAKWARAKELGAELGLK